MTETLTRDTNVGLTRIKGAIAETVASFTLQARLPDGTQILDRNGRPISTLAPYQTPEPIFRPRKGGKAPGSELQYNSDRALGQCQDQGIDHGIVDVAAYRLFLGRLGLGIDCSNFVSRTMMAVHELFDEQYADSLTYDRQTLVEQIDRDNNPWLARDARGNPRRFTNDEYELLCQNDIPLPAVLNIFSKELPYIINARRMCDPRITKELSPLQAQPGDLIAFTKPTDHAEDPVSHVAVVKDSRTHPHGIKNIVSFFHSWHTRDIRAGLMEGAVEVYTKGEQVSLRWLDKSVGLSDPTRYSGVRFLRPIAIAEALKDAA